MRKVMNCKLYDVIRSIHLTEKSSKLSSGGFVTLIVDKSSTKKDVDNVFNTVFEIKPLSVNILNKKGKKVKFKGTEGRRASVKKAIVKLPPDASFDPNSVNNAI